MAQAWQQKRSEEMRGRILEAAHRIVSEEGVEALSIRKVAKEIGYTAPIIYHYFENKEQLLACVLREGYGRILTAVEPLNSSLPPAEAIRVSFARYIEDALQWKSEYRSLMLNSSQDVLAFTSVLEVDSSGKRKALAALVSTVEAGVASGVFAPCEAEPTAQVLWASMFGLAIRFIIEDPVSPEQRQRLMERQIYLLLKGLAA